MLEAMDRRLHNEYAQQAAFHGIKIPLRHNAALQASQDMANEPWDPEMERKALADAQARVKARYGR